MEESFESYVDFSWRRFQNNLTTLKITLNTLKAPVKAHLTTLKSSLDVWKPLGKLSESLSQSIQSIHFPFHTSWAREKKFDIITSTRNYQWHVKIPLGLIRSKLNECNEWKCGKRSLLSVILLSFGACQWLFCANTYSFRVEWSDKWEVRQKGVYLQYCQALGHSYSVLLMSESSSLSCSIGQFSEVEVFGVVEANGLFSAFRFAFDSSVAADSIFSHCFGFNCSMRLMRVLVG